MTTDQRTRRLAGAGVLLAGATAALVAGLFLALVEREDGIGAADLAVAQRAGQGLAAEAAQAHSDAEAAEKDAQQTREAAATAEQAAEVAAREIEALREQLAAAEANLTEAGVDLIKERAAARIAERTSSVRELELGVASRRADDLRAAAAEAEREAERRYDDGLEDGRQAHIEEIDEQGLVLAAAGCYVHSDRDACVPLDDLARWHVITPDELEDMIDDAYRNGVRTAELPLDLGQLSRAAIATAICAVEGSLCPFAGFIADRVVDLVAEDA